MFQYAFGRARARRLGVELKLELSNRTLTIHNGFELERLFNIEASETTSTDIQMILGIQRHALVRKVVGILGLQRLFNSSVIHEPHFHFAYQMLHLNDNSYVCGYWQSEKYFAEIANEIRIEFSFKLPLSDKNADLVKKISSKDSVSLHVRRNDFVNISKIATVHGLCSMKYYKSAIKYISDRVKEPHIFIFSDDPIWVKNNLNLDCPCDFIDHNRGAESYNDMRLMSLCKHNIIANSSFSWWGAWLNPNPDKIVIAPKRWFSDQKNVQDLLPMGWIKL